MATDLLTKVEKSASSVLADGERYLGALPMTVKGPAALGSLLADLDQATALPNHVAVHGRTDELTVSDDRIPSGFLAVVTNERFLVFERSMSGRPKALVVEHPVGAVTLDCVDRGERARARTFIFTAPDGSVFAGDAGINGDAERAADRFEEALVGAGGGATS